MENLSKTLSTIYKGFEEKITKKVKAELQKQNKLPNGNGSDDEMDEDVKNYIEKNKKGNSTKARDYYKIN